MHDFKIIIRNLIFQIENTIDVLRKTLLQLMATFLVWLSIVMGIGIGILLTIKLFVTFF